MTVEHNGKGQESIKVDIVASGCSWKKGGENKTSTCLPPVKYQENEVQAKEPPFPVVLRDLNHLSHRKDIFMSFWSKKEALFSNVS